MIINFGLFVLLSLFVFFHSSLSLPSWLQFSGRLHPLFVHLPIGMYGLLLILYFLRSKFEKIPFHKIFGLGLEVCLSVTLLSSIFGLFLSLEEENHSKILIWHKYSAYSFSVVLYLATYLYKKNNQLWQTLAIYFGGLLLLITGHFGGSITHGENYILPKKQERISNEIDSTSSAYLTVVQPILDSKCVSCHKKDKSKGGLILTDSILIKKGGEHGSIISASLGSKSKLIEYIHLPITNEMHMPPDGKTQLNDHEKLLLKHWVNSGASFSKNLYDYPQNDSFKIIASIKKNKIVSKKEYGFSFATTSTISSLKGPFLSISPLFSNSPALEARFFVKSAYSTKKLQSLSKIKEQLISLNMINMPIKTNDVEIISQFPNIEKLNLNGTLISDTDLDKLTKLKNLNSLSIANTNISSKVESTFNKFIGLKEIYLNNSKIDHKTIKTWQIKFNKIKFHYQEPDTNLAELVMPTVTNTNFVLNTDDSIVLKQVVNGAKIIYTLDGTDPSSTNGQTYVNPINVNGFIHLRAIASKEGWKNSSIANFEFFKKGLCPVKTTLLAKANEKYLGLGEKTFVNSEKAPISNLTNQNWIGFREHPFLCKFSFDKPILLKTIAFCYGLQIPAYVFPPTSVKVYGSNSDGDYKLLKSVTLDKITKEQLEFIKTETLNISLSGKKYKNFLIEAKNLPVIPQWHPGKGEKGWLFIDEIFFYD